MATRDFKGWEYLSPRIRNKVRRITASDLEKIKDGDFILSDEDQLKIREDMAELIFKAMVKQAVERQRNYDFKIYDLVFSQAIKNCVSVVLSSNLDEDGID